MYTRWKNNKPQLEEAVKQSKTIADVCNHLGLKSAGGNYHTIKLWIKKHNINIDHFVGCAWNKGNFKDLDSLRCLTAIKNNLLRNRGIKCELCCRDSWMNESITLELHHIDGDRTNNEPKNLQLLCPNCHSYTDNWRRKKP